MGMKLMPVYLLCLFFGSCIVSSRSFSPNRSYAHIADDYYMGIYQNDTALLRLFEVDSHVVHNLDSNIIRVAHDTEWVSILKHPTEIIYHKNQYLFVRNPRYYCVWILTGRYYWFAWQGKSLKRFYTFCNKMEIPQEVRPKW